MNSENKAIGKGLEKNTKDKIIRLEYKVELFLEKIKIFLEGINKDPNRVKEGLIDGKQSVVLTNDEKLIFATYKNELANAQAELDELKGSLQQSSAGHFDLSDKQ